MFYVARVLNLSKTIEFDNIFAINYDKTWRFMENSERFASFREENALFGVKSW